MTGWRLSGFRRVAHLIYVEDDWLRAACGAIWWETDSIYAHPAKDKYCKACLRTRRGREWRT